jgi:hypothetical protein
MALLYHDPDKPARLPLGGAPVLLDLCKFSAAVT